MGQINTNNYPTVDSLADSDLLIVENATHGTGTTTPKQLRENAIGTDPLQTTAQTVTGAINELKNSSGLPEDPLSITHGGTGNSAGYIQTGRSTQSALGTGATIEGHNNTGAGTYCHAEGHDNSCGANASYGHVEGQSNNVSGIASHAQGYGCNVSGNYSHAGGYYNTAGYQNQTAVGKYNNNKSGTLFEVGNGTGTSARSNAFEVYSDGKISQDNGSTKFKFGNNGTSDGYYDASGIFHAFGGDSYALVGMGQVTSYSNKVADTNVYLHRAPKEGDRLFIKFSPTITDSDAQIKIYDEASGTAYTLSFNFWASGSKLAGLCLLEVQDNGFGTLGLTLKYSFEGGTNYTAGTGIEINGSAISNTAPNYGVDVDGATISSVSSGNLGTYVGESKYLILYFSASASPYSGGYTLTLSYSGSVAIQEYGTLYDGSSRYNSNISAGTMLLCEVTDTGTGSSADPVHVNIIGKIDPNSSGGNTVSKTRYQISSSSWSSSANSDGYYTLTATLNPAIGSSPDVYVAGSADGTQPTDTQKTQFSYLKRCKVNGSTLTLYASSKPSSTFYIWVEGVNGTGSGDIVGNIIQPNGESSGGGEFTNVTTLHVLNQAGSGDERWNDPSTEANGQYRNYFAYGTAADVTKIRASKYIRVSIIRKYTSGSSNLRDIWCTALIDVATLKSIETAQNSRHVRVVLPAPDTFYLYPVGNIFIYPLGTALYDKLLVQFAENTQLYDLGANYHVYDVVIDCI